MKGFAFLALFVATLAVHGVQARRLTGVTASAVAVSTGGSASASASASGTGHGKPTSATAVSVGTGCGSATTVARAKDGARVKGTTVAGGKGCAKGTTVVSGEGEKGSAEVTNVATGPIDIAVYLKRLADGTAIFKVATELAKDYEKYEHAQVVDSLVALASKEDTFELFNSVIVILLKNRGCDDFRLIFAGRRDALITIFLPADVTTCIYPRCSGFQSAGSCCGKAQLKQPQCTCTGGKCLWKQPAKQHATVPYWLCNDCGEKSPLCVCS